MCICADLTALIMRFLRENTSFITWNIPFGGETFKLSRGMSLDETSSVSSGLTVKETPRKVRENLFLMSWGLVFKISGRVFP